MYTVILIVYTCIAYEFIIHNSLVSVNNLCINLATFKSKDLICLKIIAKVINKLSVTLYTYSQKKLPKNCPNCYNNITSAYHDVYTINFY